MTKEITLDMDGTFVDLYGVKNWLNYLIKEDTTPYIIARPLITLSSFARVLNQLLKNGWIINIVSWTSKNGSLEYNEAVKVAKLKWLNKHLPSVKFSNIYIIPYGTPKKLYGNGILFDDELKNRQEWPGKSYDEKNIIKKLAALS